MQMATPGPTASAHAVRHAARTGALSGHTSNLAAGYIQANVLIVPAAAADDFAAYCARNSQACPLLGRSAPGDPGIPAIADGLDIRTDLPTYRIYEHGRFAAEVNDISALWRDDMVTFALGCSFTFEQALILDGIRLRHVEQGRNVAMYRTSVDTVAAGPFGGPLVVSMRPLPADRAARAAEITARFGNAHGAPVHVGDPAAIGIADLARPDYGDAVDVLPGEVPVFWACGVTSQAAAEGAGLPLFIAHAPGAMLVTDLLHPSYPRAAA